MNKERLKEMAEAISSLIRICASIASNIDDYDEAEDMEAPMDLEERLEQLLKVQP